MYPRPAIMASIKSRRCKLKNIAKTLKYLAISGMVLASAACQTGGGKFLNRSGQMVSAYTYVKEDNRVPDMPFPTNVLCNDVPGYIQSGPECLAVETVASADQSCPTRVGFLAIHGDTQSSVKPMLRVASTLAEEIPCSTYFVTARPGYRLPSGKRSSGNMHHHPNGGAWYDGATPHNMHAEAMLLDSLKHEHPNIPIWGLLGHSGGSNQSGWILGRYAAFAQGGVLFNGNFDVRKWESGHGHTPKTRSKSAINVVSEVPDDSIIFAITGKNDSNTRFELAEDYVRALNANGVRYAKAIKSSWGHRLQFNDELVKYVRNWIALAVKVHS